MRFAKAFLTGFTRPSGLAVVIMLTTCSLCFLISILYPPVIFSKPISKTFISSTDHYYYVTGELLELKQGVPGDKPIFAIVGASITQSSFGGTRKVGAALQDMFGVAFDVRLMTTGQQNLIEHLMVLDSLPKDRPVLAVLGVGPGRFSWTREQYLQAYKSHRFGTSSPAYLAEIARLDPAFEKPSDHPLVGHLAFYVARTEDVLTKLVHAALGGAGGRDDNQWIGRRKSDIGYREHAAQVAARLEVAGDDISSNHTLFRRLLAFAKERGNIELVVMEHPIRPGFVENFYDAESYAQHQADISSITRDADIPYIIANEETALSVDDFSDWAHIRTNSAQDQLRAIMLRAFVGEAL